jgi:hypothetical protein
MQVTGHYLRYLAVYAKLSRGDAAHVTVRFQRGKTLNHAVASMLASGAQTDPQHTDTHHFNP